VSRGFILPVVPEIDILTIGRLSTKHFRFVFVFDKTGDQNLFYPKLRIFVLLTFPAKKALIILFFCLTEQLFEK